MKNKTRITLIISIIVLILGGFLINKYVLNPSLKDAIEGKNDKSKDGRGDKAIPVDVRIIAATNKNLAKEVEKGNFRSDLFYRINVVFIEIPPLRDRPKDIPLLISHFAKKLSFRMGKKIDYINPDVYEKCCLYDWPGNVRELQNVIERAVNLCEGNTISSGIILEKLNIPDNDQSVSRFIKAQKLKKSIKTLEHQTILTCLEKNRGNMLNTARELGIARSTLYRKMREIERR